MAPLQPSPKLDQLIRFLNSVRGTDKVFMLVQYTSKILIWNLQRRSTASGSASSPAPPSKLATSLANLAGPLSDARMLLRYYGLIPLIQWIMVSESNPPPNKVLRLLYRLQNVANLAYYPLEHTYWLASHKVINLSPETQGKIGMWSCRCWAISVVLYFFQLYEEFKLLQIKERQLLEQETLLLTDGANVSSEKEKEKANEASVAPNAKMLKEIEFDKKALQDERQTILLNTVINAAYFPLTIHWSVPNSTFPELGVGIFGTIAALCQTYTAWKAFAL